MSKKEKDNQIKNYVIVALATAVVLLGVSWVNANLFSSGGAYLPSSAPSAPAPAPEPPSAKGEVNLNGAFFKGSEDAPVVVVEYSDFQCPFCGRFYEQTEGQIIKEYVDTGKAMFVYKDFPLDSIHPQATPAALAARCAGDQGKFWEYHDKIFDGGASALGEKSYQQWAADLGLDLLKFNECYQGQKHLNAVRADLQEGSTNGIRGTPGFLIGKGNDWTLVSGAQPFEAFKQVIEAKLG